MKDNAIILFGVVILLILTLLVVGTSNKNLEQSSEQHGVSIHTGELPSVPVLAIYERDGIIYGVSAAKDSSDRIFLHNIDGGAVLYEPLAQPDFWYVLSEIYSKEILP